MDRPYFTDLNDKLRNIIHSNLQGGISNSKYNRVFFQLSKPRPIKIRWQKAPLYQITKFRLIRSFRRSTESYNSSTIQCVFKIAASFKH